MYFFVFAIPTINLSNIGFRYGKSFAGADFDQYDLYLFIDLSLSKDFTSGWKLRSDIEGILSALDGKGATSFKPSLMSKAILTSAGERFDILAGVGCGYVSGETEFGEYNLGGPFFFSKYPGSQNTTYRFCIHWLSILPSI